MRRSGKLISLEIAAAALLLAGCGSVTETGTKEAYDRVIALSESNASAWLLAGGKLLATSDDAMDTEGLNEDAVSVGDMDHVSLEEIVSLNPDLLILFSTDPAQKALGEAAEQTGIEVYYTNIDKFSDYVTVMTDFTTIVSTHLN